MKETAPDIVCSPIVYTSRARVLFASLIGTTIEFFDFYIFATAAVLVFPHLFFPTSDPTTAVLQSFATFAVAFFARPLGSVLFGHFGDRVGRKATLVAALLTMGISTVAIGLLPTYEQVGVLAPILLALFRFGQGLGLGGEWGGAVLLATENAPLGKRAWYGMFPQLGAPIGFILSGASFLLLTHYLSNDDFLSWGWRVPFILSSLLVLIGLYVRLRIQETPEFQQSLQQGECVRFPMMQVFRAHKRALVKGTIIAIPAFITFYLMTVFALSWGTTALGYSREVFLQLQMLAMLGFALAIPLSAVIADRLGWHRMLLAASVLIVAFGFTFNGLFAHQHLGSTALFLGLGLVLMGATYGPLGTALAELFPTAIRYTGASLAFNFAGILGASLAPYIATTLASHYGIVAVGWYASAAAVLSLVVLWRAHDKA